MLIRFVVKNLFSFKEETEFNLLPSKSQRLNHHKYQKNGVEVLKMTALYGANGAGKSNLVKAIGLLRSMLITGVIPIEFNNQKFKLSETTQNEPVELAIEFSVSDRTYYYSVSVDKGIIIYEYFSYNNEKQEDTLIFQREYKNEKTKTTFYEDFEKNAENQILKNVIEKDFLKSNQPLFTLLNIITNDAFNDVKNALMWLIEGLVVLFPSTRVNKLANFVSTNIDFSNNLMSSFNTGIAQLKVEEKTLEEFFGKDNQKEIDEIKYEAQINPNFFFFRTIKKKGEEFDIVNENGSIKVQKLFLEHKGENNENIPFKVSEESDGTQRLLEYLPVFHTLIGTDRTFIIDEIERSIHPIIIKELIRKFSEDTKTKGQLIFTTHEFNLLDKEIFRQDEVWFAEKKGGATKLSPLSDFIEHATIDFDKGYLAGRYGGIPFIGDLQNLNWHKFEEENLENQKLNDNAK